jgi:hypothetical protein
MYGIGAWQVGYTIERAAWNGAVELGRVQEILDVFYTVVNSIRGVLVLSDCFVFLFVTNGFVFAHLFIPLRTPLPKVEG